MATYSWNFTTRATFTVLPVVTPTHYADWAIAIPHLLWLVTCSLSANLLSSSRLISSSLRWGPFSCCLTISRSFLCCWERRVTVRWVLRVGYLYTGLTRDHFFFLKLFFFFCSTQQKMKTLSSPSYRHKQESPVWQVHKTLEALIFSTLDCSSALFRWARKKATVLTD